MVFPCSNESQKKSAKKECSSAITCEIEGRVREWQREKRVLFQCLFSHSINGSSKVLKENQLRVYFHYFRSESSSNTGLSPFSRQEGKH